VPGTLVFPNRGSRDGGPFDDSFRAVLAIALGLVVAHGMDGGEIGIE
jgi:hypothetical protein